MNEFPLIIRALLNGATLVMDEFDASIHPMALMNIISIFHNDEINKKHAQLIFNTHNPIFWMHRYSAGMKSNLWRETKRQIAVFIMRFRILKRQMVCEKAKPI